MRYTSTTGTMDRLIPIVSFGLKSFVEAGEKKKVCRYVLGTHSMFLCRIGALGWVGVTGHAGVIGAKYKIKTD